MLIFHCFYKQSMAGHPTQCAISENSILIFYWFYKQNNAEDASGIHCTAMAHVGKQNVDIPLDLCVKH